MLKKPKLFKLAIIWVILQSLSSLVLYTRTLDFFQKIVEPKIFSFISLIGLFYIVLVIILLIKFIQMNVAAIKIIRVYLMLIIVSGSIKSFLYFSGNDVRAVAYFLPFFSFIPTLLTIIYLFRKDVLIIANEITIERSEQKKRKKMNLI